ncbi:Histone H4 [Mycena chlorophos]|uniref:Histone H4 n=1 Tax=Mycena chlorophos TaxID=658473 RepID=A0A8H6W5X5_MYCCL|nr:Histone H4 [Mycena chlorophos]
MRTLLRSAEPELTGPSLGISKNEIQRIARRGGVKRISRSMYGNARGQLKMFLQGVVRDAALLTKHKWKNTVTAADVRSWALGVKRFDGCKPAVEYCTWAKNFRWHLREPTFALGRNPGLVIGSAVQQDILARKPLPSVHIFPPSSVRFTPVVPNHITDEDQAQSSEPTLVVVEHDRPPSQLSLVTMPGFGRTLLESSFV